MREDWREVHAHRDPRAHTDSGLHMPLRQAHTHATRYMHTETQTPGARSHMRVHTHTHTHKHTNTHTYLDTQMPAHSHTQVNAHINVPPDIGHSHHHAGSWANTKIIWRYTHAAATAHRHLHVD